MIAKDNKHRLRLLACSVLMGVAVAGTANAQTPATPPSENAMVNLVRLLVKQGVLTQENGDVLMRQALAEAAKARPAGTETAATELPAAPAGTIRVPYVPETVRNQIRDEIRADVMRQAKAEGWATAAQAAPDWTRRISLFGDVRFRSQSDLYSKVNSDLIFDFARINAEGPTDLLTATSLPYLNTRIDRVNRLRLRARLGAAITLGSGVSAAIALATGDDNSPISTNESLGGGLGKRDIWLDQAYLRLAPKNWVEASFGRFPNPFESTDLLYDEDLRFDGVAAELNAGQLIGSGFELALRGGAFPLDFGSADFPVTSNVKRKGPEKYLFSGQVTAGADIIDDVHVSVSAAYHSFKDVQGQLSDPCALYLGVAECSTDGLQPFFLRKGNTLSFLRNIAVDPSPPPGTIAEQPQFLGLTFDYDVLDINASIKVPVNKHVAVALSGNYLRNLAFKRGDLCRNGIAGQPLNNGGSDGDGNVCSATDPTSFVGGDTGYQIKAMIGHDQPARRGAWNVFAGYRYLESDAVLDSLTDSDFHLGGTNAKGYFLGGKFGIFDGVTFGGRWMSANEISGEPFAIDVLQIDLEAKF